MKKYLIIFSFLLTTLILHSQQISVLDHSNLQPVSNCLIINNSKTVSTSTNNDGIADISAFSKTDTLIFKHLSFQMVKTTKQELSRTNNTQYLTTAVINLDEIVFSANKVEEKNRDLATRIDIIQARSIEFNNPQTSADVLIQSGKVFVQQSQLGAGSPVIRGMETNRV
ncbi:MAG: hypothetical protein ACOYN5_11670, partial [Bacteroidales bacterium]